jgi:hypothetical protein
MGDISALADRIHTLARNQPDRALIPLLLQDHSFQRSVQTVADAYNDAKSS